MKHREDYWDRRRQDQRHEAERYASEAALRRQFSANSEALSASFGLRGDRYTLDDRAWDYLQEERRKLAESLEDCEVLPLRLRENLAYDLRRVRIEGSSRARDLESYLEVFRIETVKLLPRGEDLIDILAEQRAGAMAEIPLLALATIVPAKQFDHLLLALRQRNWPAFGRELIASAHHCFPALALIDFRISRLVVKARELS